MAEEPEVEIITTSFELALTDYGSSSIAAKRSLVWAYLESLPYKRKRFATCAITKYPLVATLQT